VKILRLCSTLTPLAGIDINQDSAGLSGKAENWPGGRYFY
jgi:hypothetical protein